MPVTLLEKGAELGGNAILSGGMIWTYADYDRMRTEIPNGDAMIQWMIHENIDAARTWLALMESHLLHPQAPTGSVAATPRPEPAAVPPASLQTTCRR